MTLPPFKRIVTGHNEQGRAIISEQGALPSVFPIKAIPGAVFHEIWNTHEMPVSIDNAQDPTVKDLQLPPNAMGSVIRVVDIPPDSVQNAVSDDAAAQAFDEIGGGEAATSNSDSKHKLMHRTETLDYGIVTEGEVWLVVDEEETHLTKGDIVVQRGTNHAWSNRTQEMARMVFILLDGKYQL